MEFGLAITTSVEIDDNKVNIIQTLSDELEKYFEHKSYGKSIKSLVIGIVCISPRFERFFKNKKPTYIKGKKVITADGISVTVEDSLEYSIKLNYTLFKNAEDAEAKNILSEEILASLGFIEQMKSKISEFDFEMFSSDLIEYFYLRNLL